jgi:hypothetical protein
MTDESNKQIALARVMFAAFQSLYEGLIRNRVFNRSDVEWLGTDITTALERYAQSHALREAIERAMRPMFDGLEVMLADVAEQDREEIMLTPEGTVH